MKKTLVRNAFGMWLLSGAAALAIVAIPTTTIAAEKPAPGPKVQKPVGEALQAAIKAVQAKDTAGANAQLAAARAVPALTDIDTIEIDVVTAFVAINSGDHPGALAAYKRVVASPQFSVVIQPPEQTSTLKNMMILANEAKDYSAAIQAGETLAKSGGMDDKAAASLAAAYYYNKDYAKAQALAQKSVDAAIAAGGTPDKGSLQIMMNSYAEQKDQVHARAVLEQLATYYPGPEYWAKMVDITMGTTPGLKDMQLLQLYRLRVLSGADGDAGDYTVGADLAMKNGYPGEARSMLQTAQARNVGGIGGKLSEANGKAAADEKTLGSTAAAAEKSANGQLDVLLAEQYYGYGRYADAVTAAKRAQGKSGVKDPEEPKMVVGMALAASGQYADAITAFNSVGGSDAQKKIAHVWVVYCQSKSRPATAAAAAPAPAPAH
jgi:tetratricopeptide (TPR) repeat protein